MAGRGQGAPIIDSPRRLVLSEVVPNRTRAGPRGQPAAVLNAPGPDLSDGDTSAAGTGQSGPRPQR